MRLLSSLFLLMFLAGCGAGMYKMPKDEYRERVRTLGVLPLMVDADSTILHPEQREVVEVLRRQNRDKHDELIRMLQKDRKYYDIRAIPGDPREYFDQLVMSQTLRGQGDEHYRRYYFDPFAAARIAEEKMVDAFVVVIMNGVLRTEKRWERNSPIYLKADYNNIQVTAAVVLPSGEIAWEYTGNPGKAFLPLQYPAFEEAHYNKKDAVRIEFITVEGLERTLEELEDSLFSRAKFPKVYRELFGDLATGLDTGFLNPFREKTNAPASSGAK